DRMARMTASGQHHFSRRRHPPSARGMTLKISCGAAGRRVGKSSETTAGAPANARQHNPWRVRERVHGCAVAAGQAKYKIVPSRPWLVPQNYETGFAIAPNSRRAMAK